MVCLRLHSKHQLLRGLRSSIQNRSSTNNCIKLLTVVFCDLSLFALFNLADAVPRCQINWITFREERSYGMNVVLCGNFPAGETSHD